MAVLALPNPDASAADRVEGIPAHLAAAQLEGSIPGPTLAKQIGITTTTLKRLYAGSNPTQSTIVACLRWLARH